MNLIGIHNRVSVLEAKLKFQDKLLYVIISILLGQLGISVVPLSA